ncbi:hypothetical protein H4F17_06080 [Vibrio cholerae]
MTNKDSALKRGERAFEEMVAAGIKVTKNAVAKRAGFNHSNFRYPEFANLKDDIETMEVQQKLGKQSDNINELKLKNADLEAQLKSAKKDLKERSGQVSNEVKLLMEKLTECYRLNDKLRGENADLRNQLNQQGVRVEEILKVDRETGEVISGVFDK